MKQYATGSFSVEELLKELVDQTWFEENLKDSCTPSYVYQEEDKNPGDTVWLYSTSRKTYVPMKLNFKVEPMEDLEDFTTGDKVMCMICHDIYLIPYDGIKCVGFN